MTKVCYVLSFVVLLFTSTIAHCETVVKSSLEDQTDVKLTIYNNDLALVKDIRKVDIPAGSGELRFMDVASSIMPETVHARSLNNPDEFAVIEQNYEYDLIDANKLLDKFVGKKIKIINWNDFQDRIEEVEAELLSNNDGQVFKINNEIFLGRPGYKVLPEIPENLISKPTLTWLYESGVETGHELEVYYLARKLSWHADYVVVLNDTDELADLSGWVTLNNQSGASYKNAGLKLVAGKVNVADARPGGLERRSAYKALAMDSAMFKEQSFSDYHVYNLRRKTTVKNNQTKQISFIELSDIEIKREYVVNGDKTYFTRRHSGRSNKLPVEIYIKFSNSIENNMGAPLPAGVMRVYKNDKDKSLQFVGEDRIDHSPKDEDVNLKLGEAFDITAEKKQIDYKEISSKMRESEWEVRLRNHKESDVVVSVIERLSGNWEVISNSHKFEKIDAFTLKFDVKAPKDKEVVVKYRLRAGI